MLWCKKRHPIATLDERVWVLIEGGYRISRYQQTGHIRLCRGFYYNVTFEGYQFNPIPIDIHIGVIRIPTEKMLNDFAISNNSSIIKRRRSKLLL